MTGTGNSAGAARVLGGLQVPGLLDVLDLPEFLDIDPIPEGVTYIISI